LPGGGWRPGRITVLSAVGMCRRTMASEAPASWCRGRGRPDPWTRAATEPARWPAPRPGTGPRPARPADLPPHFPAVTPAAPPAPASGTPGRRAAFGAG
jgi:hypothetical protein